MTLSLPIDPAANELLSADPSVWRGYLASSAVIASGSAG